MHDVTSTLIQIKLPTPPGNGAEVSAYIIDHADVTTSKAPLSFSLFKRLEDTRPDPILTV